MSDLVIDAHQHVWDPGRPGYDWLTSDLAPIRRAIDFDELRPALHRVGVDATVLVQSADSQGDTRLLAECATRAREVVAVVAYVRLEHPCAGRTGRREICDRPPTRTGSSRGGCRKDSDSSRQPD